MISAFIQEGIIYEYMNDRFSKGALYLYKKIISGAVIVKQERVKVKFLKKITDTKFPDVDSILLPGETINRPAEIKFVTSAFDYHTNKKKITEYMKFKADKGFIISLKHDYLPNKLLSDYSDLDVYELDYGDFISFAQENFYRLLNRQLKLREHSRIWIMMQSKNFSVGADGVLPARESKIWCPSENLDSFDLDVNDKVLFIKTSGASYQKVNSTFKHHKEIFTGWKLEEVFIAKVTSNILSREEYCSINRKVNTDPLWYDETPTGLKDPRITKRVGSGIRWKKVFEFEKKYCISSLGLELSDLHKIIPEFVLAILGAYGQRRSTEINHDTYEDLLEYFSTI